MEVNILPDTSKARSERDKKHQKKYIKQTEINKKVVCFKVIKVEKRQSSLQTKL